MLLNGVPFRPAQAELPDSDDETQRSRTFKLEETGEVFLNRKDHEARRQQLSLPIWGCAETGDRGGLLYAEAKGRLERYAKHRSKIPDAIKRCANAIVVGYTNGELIAEVPSSLGSLKENVTECLWDLLSSRLCQGEVVEIFAEDDPEGLNGPFGKGVVIGASGAGTVESIAYSDYPLTEEGYPAFVPASSFGGGRPGYCYTTDIYGTGYYRDCMVCVDDTVAHFSRTGPGYRAPGTPLIGMHVRAEFEGDNPPYVDGVIIEVNAEGTKLAINYFDGDTGEADFPEEGLELRGSSNDPLLGAGVEGDSDVATDIDSYTVRKLTSKAIGTDTGTWLPKCSLSNLHEPGKWTPGELCLAPMYKDGAVKYARAVIDSVDDTPFVDTLGVEQAMCWVKADGKMERKRKGFDPRQHVSAKLLRPVYNFPAAPKAYDVLWLIEGSDVPSSRGIERVDLDRLQRYKELTKSTIKQFVDTQTVEDKNSQMLTIGGQDQEEYYRLPADLKERHSENRAIVDLLESKKEVTLAPKKPVIKQTPSKKARKSIVTPVTPIVVSSDDDDDAIGANLAMAMSTGTSRSPKYATPVDTPSTNGGGLPSGPGKAGKHAAAVLTTPADLQQQYYQSFDSAQVNGNAMAMAKTMASAAQKQSDPLQTSLLGQQGAKKKRYVTPQRKIAQQMEEVKRFQRNRRNELMANFVASEEQKRIRSKKKDMKKVVEQTQYRKLADKQKAEEMRERQRLKNEADAREQAVRIEQERLRKMQAAAEKQIRLSELRTKLAEYRRPKFDLALDKSPPLPIPNLVPSRMRGAAFRDLVAVYLFTKTFHKLQVIDFEDAARCTMDELETAVISRAPDSIIGLWLVNVLWFIFDQLPRWIEMSNARVMGLTLDQCDIESATVSELVRLTLLSEHFAGDAVADMNRGKLFFELEPRQKLEILVFLTSLTTTVDTCKAAIDSYKKVHQEHEQGWQSYHTEMRQKKQALRSKFHEDMCKVAVIAPPEGVEFTPEKPYVPTPEEVAQQTAARITIEETHKDEEADLDYDMTEFNASYMDQLFQINRRLRAYCYGRDRHFRSVWFFPGIPGIYLSAPGSEELEATVYAGKFKGVIKPVERDDKGDKGDRDGAQVYTRCHPALPEHIMAKAVKSAITGDIFAEYGEDEISDSEICNPEEEERQRQLAEAEKERQMQMQIDPAVTSTVGCDPMPKVAGGGEDAVAAEGSAMETEPLASAATPDSPKSVTSVASSPGAGAAVAGDGMVPRVDMRLKALDPDVADKWDFGTITEVCVTAKAEDGTPTKFNMNVTYDDGDIGDADYPDEDDGVVLLPPLMGGDNWYYFDNIDDIKAYLNALNFRGKREKTLRQNLEAGLPLIEKGLKKHRFPKYNVGLSNSQKKTATNVISDGIVRLLDRLSERIRKNRMSSLSEGEATAWATRLEAAKTVERLKKLIQELEQSVLNPYFKPAPASVDAIEGGLGQFVIGKRLYDSGKGAGEEVEYAATTAPAVQRLCRVQDHHGDWHTGHIVKFYTKGKGKRRPPPHPDFQDLGAALSNPNLAPFQVFLDDMRMLWVSSAEMDGIEIAQRTAPRSPRGCWEQMLSRAKNLSQLKLAVSALDKSVMSAARQIDAARKQAREDGVAAGHDPWANLEVIPEVGMTVHAKFEDDGWLFGEIEKVDRDKSKLEVHYSDTGEKGWADYPDEDFYLHVPSTLVKLGAKTKSRKWTDMRAPPRARKMVSHSETVYNEDDPSDEEGEVISTYGIITSLNENKGTVEVLIESKKMTVKCPSDDLTMIADSFIPKKKDMEDEKESSNIVKASPVKPRRPSSRPNYRESSVEQSSSGNSGPEDAEEELEDGSGTAEDGSSEEAGTSSSESSGDEFARASRREQREQGAGRHGGMTSSGRMTSKVNRFEATNASEDNFARARKKKQPTRGSKRPRKG